MHARCYFTLDVNLDIDVPSQGNKVKVLMKFEGRELQFKLQGKEMLLVSDFRVQEVLIRLEEDWGRP
jgi:translation initiation factor IF-3